MVYNKTHTIIIKTILANLQNDKDNTGNLGRSPLGACANTITRTTKPTK
jgi:hypothetical protein